MKNKPYFGFLETLDPQARAKAVRHLAGNSISQIEQHTIGSDVVEEIIRRHGDFYTADEARKLNLFTVEHDDSFFARFPFIEGDTATGPDGIRWRSITVIQYCYGIYLRNLLVSGKIAVDEIKTTEKTYA